MILEVLLNNIPPNIYSLLCPLLFGGVSRRTVLRQCRSSMSGLRRSCALSNQLGEQEGEWKREVWHLEVR